MSHLTDEARAPFRDAQPTIECADSLEAIVAANPSRRSILKNGVYSLSLLPLFGTLAACDDDDNATPTPAPAPTPTPTPPSYAVNFTSVGATEANTVTIPSGYTVDVLFKAGDLVTTGTGYTGTAPTPAQAETWSGGNHDGMEYFPLTGVDQNTGGLLAVNFEYPDFTILGFNDYTSGGAPAPTADQRQIALSAVGVAVVEIAKGTDGKFAVKAGSAYNKRYTGNTNYLPSGPAAARLSNPVKGTLNNCSSGRTPWGTYLTCEETLNNYWDPSQPATDYGWVVEIDPYNQLAQPTKRTAMGRFNHENVAFMTDANNRVAFYMGDDNTPGCIYKFVPDRSFSASNRAANVDLLDFGTLYVARFNANGTGDWIALRQGQNGLVVGAQDPGNISQSTTPPTPVTVNFASQADVLVNCQAAARVVGGTVMDRPEWITVAPDNKTIYVTLTNNSGRRVTDSANPRVSNLHGHIVKFSEENNSPLSTRFTWNVFLLAGDPTLAAGGTNLIGDINGDTFSSPDGIRIDTQGRLWVQTDHSIPGNSGVTGTTIEQKFGHNAMFYIDQTTKQSKRFLVGPTGCEITGIAYTPDLANFFINIQHPTDNWPVNGQAARSSTIVVRRTDGKPVGN